MMKCTHFNPDCIRMPKWRSIYKAECYWRLSNCGLLELPRLLHNSLPQARAASGDVRKETAEVATCLPRQR